MMVSTATAVLAGLAVANDQFALATADRHHRVDGLDTGLQRLRHRAAGDNARRHFLDDVGLGGVDRAFAVDRVAQGIDHAALQFRGPTGTSRMRPVVLTWSPSDTPV